MRAYLGNTIYYKLPPNLQLRLGKDPISSDFTIRQEEHGKQSALEITVELGE